MLLSPDLLLDAYASGIFPMAESRDSIDIVWLSPKRRGVIPLDRYHVPRSLKKIINKNLFEIRLNRDFESVIRACAEPSESRPETWLNDDLIENYLELHNQGHAHSVEAWQNDELVGGLYGISLGGAFFGESMFSRSTNASKVALIHLIERLNIRGYKLLDTQFITNHLRQFGAQSVTRDTYLDLLGNALEAPVTFVDE